MASIRRVLGSRIALGAALLASACQHDSTADFDDTNLQPADGGSAATSSGAAAGQGAEAATSVGGSSAEAGGSSGGSGGTAAASAGTGASSSAGKTSAAGSDGGGGKGSAGAAGTANEAGKGAQGGSAGSSGVAGKGGGPVIPDPEPVTFVTADIDDTNVASCMPNMNFGEQVSVNVDGDLSCRYETLFNVPLKEIPEGALVSEARLVLTCINLGDPVTVSYVDQAWNELTVRWNNRPDVGTQLGTFTCEELGELSIDLLVPVKAWLAGTHASHGIYLRQETTDGSDYSTSEAKDASARPKLVIVYTLPVK